MTPATAIDYLRVVPKEPVMKITAAERRVLQWMADGGIADRIWTGREHRWLCDGRPETRVVKSLIGKGLVWTHYPHGGGSAQINEAGRAAL